MVTIFSDDDFSGEGASDADASGSEDNGHPKRRRKSLSASPGELVFLPNGESVEIKMQGGTTDWAEMTVDDAAMQVGNRLGVPRRVLGAYNASNSDGVTENANRSYGVDTKLAETEELF